jgi:hypothetical protein
MNPSIVDFHFVQKHEFDKVFNEAEEAVLKCHINLNPRKECQVHCWYNKNCFKRHTETVLSSKPTKGVVFLT